MDLSKQIFFVENFLVGQILLRRVFAAISSMIAFKCRYIIFSEVYQKDRLGFPTKNLQY